LIATSFVTKLTDGQLPRNYTYFVQAENRRAKSSSAVRFGDWN
jgi:hypothetical protein